MNHVDEISVVIPTYRRPGELQACLESLFADDLTGVIQVVLVVHDEDEAGMRVAARWEGTQDRVRIVFTKIASRSAARNMALPVCRANWCYFLDDDVIVPPGTLPALRRAISEHPEAQVVGGPNRLPPGSGLFERCADQVLKSRFGAGTMRRRYVGMRRSAWVDERSLIACNMAVETKILHEEGPFNELLDYGEETYFLGRLFRQGRKLLHTPDVWVYHHRRSDWSGFYIQAFRSGAGRARQSWLMPQSLTLECLGPPALVVLGLCAAIFARPVWLWPLVLYGAACLLTAMAAAWRERSPGIGVGTAVLIPTGHVAYGLGFWLSPWFSTRRHSTLRGLAPWLRSLSEWVIKSSKVPVLNSFYRGYYYLALLCIRVWVRGADIPLREIWLHRGLTGPDWRPGVSDVDLILELPRKNASEEKSLVDRWHRGYERLRGFFPILGEVQMATHSELECYLNDGDIRSLALRGQARPLLHGRILPRASAWPLVAAVGLRSGVGSAATEMDWLAAKRGIDAWTEELHAYVRLTHLYFDPLQGRQRTWLNTRKAILDILRYGRLIQTPGDPDNPNAWQACSRSAQAVLHREGAVGNLLGKLERDRGEDILEVVGEALTVGLAELETDARRVLHHLPDGDCIKNPEGGEREQNIEEREAFDRVCRGLRSLLGRTFRCALHDNVFCFYLGLEDSDVFSRSRSILPALRAFKLAEPGMAGPLLPLLPASWRLAFWGPYLEDPLKCISAVAVAGNQIDGCGTLRSGSSEVLARHKMAGWRLGVEDIALPPQPLAQLLVRESMSHLMMNWRAFDNPTRRENNFYRWTYLFSRVMSLRLMAEKGEAWPAFPLEPTAIRFAAHYPEASHWIKQQMLGRISLGNWDRHREFLSQQIRTMIR